MATIPEAFAVAVQHHQAGRLQAAEQIYRRILAVEPNQPDALHLLGVIASQLGNHAAAVECIERAIQVQGGAAAYHNNLGEAYRALGRNAEAVACYRRALELKPDYADAHSNLGNVLKDAGALDEAAACYRRALELKPDFAEAHNNLGAALKEQGKLDEGVAACRRALAIRPDFALAHNNLGSALEAFGQREEAVEHYRRAISLRPDFAEAHNNLGNALKDAGLLDEATGCFRRALALRPEFAEVYSNLGVVLQEQGKFDEAIACWRRAVQLKPDYAEAHNNLANVLKEHGRIEESLACCRRALALKPDYAAAHNNLGNALKEQGRLDEALACYRRALELKPDFCEADDNRLFTLHYLPGVTPAELLCAHCEFDRRHTSGFQAWTVEGGRWTDADRRLRIGFVSPDLGRHPVGYCLVRVLEKLALTPQCRLSLRESSEERSATFAERKATLPANIETVCYSDRILKDDLTARLQSAATAWHDTAGMSDEQLAEQLRRDRIDILFDLAGHTARNRLLVFARKLAPIQITWIGYEGTTGLAAMDYLLADRHLVPPGSEQHHRERVLRMPDGFICYDPPAAAPPVGPPPSRDCGYVTFGCFNNPAKINADVIAVWAETLRRLPSARLILKYRGLDDPGVARRFYELFSAQGVAAERLEVLPASSYADYLATYHRIDVALDPFPFSGSATTCEALWMGVPVVTCPGETFASRHSLSHISSAGLTETIALDLPHYVDLAVTLAGDLPRLTAMRASLRERMAASPLCDGPRFARSFEAMLREVWERQ